MNIGLTDENYEALARYRQDRAHETLAEQESGRPFSNLFDSRQRGDYDECDYSIQEERDELYPKAKKFIEDLGVLLK